MKKLQKDRKQPYGKIDRKNKNKLNNKINSKRKNKQTPKNIQEFVFKNSI